MQQHNAPQERAVPDEVDALRQPVHRSGIVEPGRQITHRHHEHEREHEQRRCAFLTLPPREREQTPLKTRAADDLACEKRQTALENRYGRDGIDAAGRFFPREIGQHGEKHEQKARRLDGEERGREHRIVADAAGVENFPQRLVDAGEQHQNGACREQGKSALDHFSVKIALQQHGRKEKQHDGDEVEDRHRHRDSVHLISPSRDDRGE